jgi:hypothetical protein
MEVSLRSEQEGNASQQADESGEHEGEESIEGKPLQASNALPEETAMMIQIRNAYLAFDAMLHIIINFSCAAMTVIAQLPLAQLHLLLGDDPRVERHCQSVEDVDQKENQDVDIFE